MRLFRLSGRHSDTEETIRRLDIYPATSEDLIEAVRHLPNVEEVGWCETHRQRALRDGLVCQWATLLDVLQVSGGSVGTHQNLCVVVPVAVVPLGGDDT